jgi:ketosteroid isomerase-like protein
MKQVTLLSLILVVTMTAARGQTHPAATNNPSAQNEEIFQLEMGIMFARLVPVKQITLLSLQGKSEKIAIPDLNEVLADEYIRIDARGQVITKHAELEKSRQTTLSQPCKGYIGNIQFTVLGDVVVVKSLTTMESCDNKNFESTGQYRVTNIYSKRQGKWQLLSSQWTGASV